MSSVNHLPASVENKINRWQQMSQPAPLLLTGDVEACQAVIERLIAQQHIGDVIRVNDSKRSSISIKTIRTALAEASSTSWGSYRLVIIEQAERLSIPAANALLKSLEESPKQTRFILITRWRRRLLPTLLSRCEHLFLMSPARLDSSGSSALSQSVLTRLTQWNGSKQLTDADLQLISQALSSHLRIQGPTSATKRGYMRLRDYYRVMAQPGGNLKLARDVLLASLPEKI